MARTSNIELAHLFEAPRKRVFRAWIDAAEARSWFPVVACAEVVSAKSDPVEGGKYRYTMRVEDIDELVLHGEYKEFEKPSKLALTMTFESVADFEPFPKTTVTALFEDYDTRTQVVLDHSGLLGRMESSVMREWQRAFARLATHLQADTDD